MRRWFVLITYISSFKFRVCAQHPVRVELLLIRKKKKKSSMYQSSMATMSTRAPTYVTTAKKRHGDAIERNGDTTDRASVADNGDSTHIVNVNTDTAKLSDSTRI